MTKVRPDYSDKPTVIVGFDSNTGEFGGITTEGFDMPLRFIIRDYGVGVEPDEDGDLYEDEQG